MTKEEAEAEIIRGTKGVPLPGGFRMDLAVASVMKEHNERGVLRLRKAWPVDLETFGFYTRAG